MWQLLAGETWVAVPESNCIYPGTCLAPRNQRKCVVSRSVESPGGHCAECLIATLGSSAFEPTRVNVTDHPPGAGRSLGHFAPLKSAPLRSALMRFAP